MKGSNRNLIMGIGFSIAFISAFLFIAYGGSSELDNGSLLTFFRYQCNITLMIQGDVDSIKDINRITVFPNTTRQTVFLEEVKCIVDDVEVQGCLTMDDDGNAVLVFDFPAMRNGSIIMLYFIAKIAQRKAVCNFSIDELKRASFDEIPLNLTKLYSGNSSTWPISVDIYNLSHELAGKGGNIFDVLSSFSKWMEENIAYPLDQRVKVVIGPQYPDETYERRVGDCDDCSILLITMCRAVGIPSFMQIGGIPIPESQKEIVRYDGNYVYRSRGIGWHAWSMVYFPKIGWVPVDLTYFDDARIEIVPGPLAYIRSPLNLTPRIVSSAYFKVNPIIYANVTTLRYVDEVRAWETAIAEGKIRYLHVEELEILADNILVPIEVLLILACACSLALFIAYFQLKRRKCLLKKV